MFLTAILISLWFMAIYGLFYYINGKILAGERVFKDYVFNIIFALLFAIWGFIIMADAFRGKMMGALLFAVMGWFLSFIFSFPMQFIPKAKLTVFLKVLVCVAFAYLVFTTNYATEPEEDFGIPAGSSHSCCICGERASKLYGGDYWCLEHYYMAKTMDGDLSP